MFEDIVSGAINNIGSISFSIFGLIGMLQLPAFIVWACLTFYGLYLMFLRKFVYVSPFQWKWDVTIAKPYADMSVGLFPDRGAFCEVLGIRRFKLKTEGFVMQRMDTKDIYRPMEVMVCSMGPSKKFYASRVIDRENGILYLKVENPQVASIHYLDTLSANDPDFLESHTPSMVQIFMYWTITSIFLLVGCFVIYYPIYLKMSRSVGV